MDDIAFSDAKTVDGRFDVKFYKRRHADLRGLNDEEATNHWQEYGRSEGRDPNLDAVMEALAEKGTKLPDDFSPSIYRLLNQDLVQPNQEDWELVLHYMEQGAKEGRPYALPQDLKKGDLPPLPYEDIVRCHLDQEFYLSYNTDLMNNNNIDLVRHYLLFGWKQNYNPTQYFNVEFYLDHYEDVRRDGLEPFTHFLRFGFYEGRLPAAEINPRLKDMLERQLRLLSPDVEHAVGQEFDVNFYRKKYPEIAKLNIDPVKHFNHTGWRLDMDPNDSFSTSQYLALYHDVAATGENPFYHYLKVGRERGRIGKLGNLKADQARDLIMNHGVVLKALRKLVDYDYYRSVYFDLTDAVDPAEHYLHYGAREGRDPSAEFSTNFYTTTYPDVVRFGINPLYHYHIWGRAQGFSPSALATHVGRPPKKNNVGESVSDDVLNVSRIVAQDPIPSLSKTFNPKSLGIHFVIPEFEIGGGGHMNIFRMIRWLEFFGHICKIWIHRPTLGRSSYDREDMLLKHYQVVKAEIEPIGPAFYTTDIDALIATSWDTVFPVMGHRQSKSRFYFVQDYEPFFSPRGALAVVAEQTYLEDIACICGGPWLHEIMSKRYGRWSRFWWFAYDPQVYFPPAAIRSKPHRPRIALYSREGTPRRAVTLAFAALKELAARSTDFHVDMFGSDDRFEELPFSATFHGILGEGELGELYRSCDVGVCFSATNYSIVSMEMMACHLPVVELDLENTRAVFPDDVVLYTRPRVGEIADAIENLLRSPSKARGQAERAAKWITQFSWEKSARSIEAALIERLGIDGYRGEAKRSSSLQAGRSATPTATVVIPTYNGGTLFEKTLQAVVAQRVPWSFEIIVIDSESSDGTAEVARRYDEVRFVPIAKADFQHGRTRNYGVELAQAPFVAFLTQDAMPANDAWLYNIVTHLQRCPEAAGSFGRHIAWPKASPFTQRDLDGFFADFKKQHLFVSKYTDMQRWNTRDERWRQALHYYSDNNSCLRKSVWKDIPYPEVPFGEDQAWALEVIKAGYGRLYTPMAVVYHSHDYDEFGTFERAKTEAEFFTTYFRYDVAPKNLEQAVKRRNSDDTRWALQNEIAPSELAKRLQLNVASMMGYWCGSTALPIPSKANQTRISLAAASDALNSMSQRLDKASSPERKKVTQSSAKQPAEQTRAVRKKKHA